MVALKLENQHEVQLFFIALTKGIDVLSKQVLERDIEPEEEKLLKPLLVGGTMLGIVKDFLLYSKLTIPLDSIELVLSEDFAKTCIMLLEDISKNIHRIAGKEKDIDLVDQYISNFNSVDDILEKLKKELE